MKRAVQVFAGEIPRVASTKLPESAAQSAINARLLNGDLTAWRQFAQTKELANSGPVETVYLLNDKWLSWDADVNVARGFVAGDTTYRVYLTGPGVYSTPQWTNYAMATTGSEPYPVDTRPLGVPAPDSPPTLVVDVDPSADDAISVTDNGTNLAAYWTSSGDIPSVRTVSQESTGALAPCYRLFANENYGALTFTYRDFGTVDSLVTTFTADFEFEPGMGDWQAGFAITNNGAGVGCRAQVGTNGTAAVFSMGNGSAWGSVWSPSALDSLTMTSGVTYTFHATTTYNSDGSTTVVAQIKQGATVLSTLTLRQGFTFGGVYGFVMATGTGAKATRYTNITVTGSGSISAANVSNIATSYVVTFVNDIGEESAPSLASNTILRPDGVSVEVTTTVSLPTGLPDDYGITSKRIYRSATGSSGTEFRFVAEIPLSQATYTDTLTDVELGEALLSTIWALPPDDLHGIMALPNGIMVGFSKNELCLSAQNYAHAWPVPYRLKTDTDIVGIANIDNTVVIGTRNFLYIATGNSPDAYSMSKFEVPYAATSKRGFAYLTGIGVVFPGPDGLMAVRGPGQVINATARLFTRRQWQALDPSSLMGIQHDDMYFLFWTAGSARGCYVLDMNEGGFGAVEMSFHACAAFADPITDNLYLVLDHSDEPTDPLLPIPPVSPGVADGKTIFEFEGDPSNHMVYRWRSKLWLNEYPVSMLMAQVRAADYQNIVWTLYGDGAEVDQRVIATQTEFTLRQADEPYNTLEMELIGTSTVRVIQAAEDVLELT